MNEIRFPSLDQKGLTLILGLGETGLAAVRWCLRHGVPLRLADTRTAVQGLDTLGLEQAGDVEVCLGEQALATATLEGVTRIVISPGLNPHEAPLSDFLEIARTHGVEVIGEIELFARALADLAATGYTPRVLGVTGTNGKTTVTALTRSLVEAAGMTAVAAGNISPPALTALMQGLDQGTLPDVWVIELSSFQLESTYSLACDAAVVLNITQDHLDWHGSLSAYAAAKARLFEHTSLAIVNRDDPFVLAMVPGLDKRHVRSFGRGLPEYEGDLGLEDSHGIEWLASVPQQEPEPGVGGKRKHKSEALRPTGIAQRLMPVEALRIRGRHNALNALAALALAQACGARTAPMLHALRDYAGEPHRCAFVRTIAGVDFVNDSKGTNVGATVAALEGIGRPVVLIAGGLGKGQDFTPLAEAIQRYARSVVLIGRDADVIQATLSDTTRVSRAASMEEAVGTAMGLADPGDVVLLSPACASMDMFRNYGERGHRFAEAVDGLALDRGDVA